MHGKIFVLETVGALVVLDLLNIRPMYIGRAALDYAGP